MHLDASEVSIAIVHFTAFWLVLAQQKDHERKGF